MQQLEGLQLEARRLHLMGSCFGVGSLGLWGFVLQEGLGWGWRGLAGSLLLASVGIGFRRRLGIVCDGKGRAWDGSSWNIGQMEAVVAHAKKV